MDTAGTHLERDLMSDSTTKPTPCLLEMEPSQQAPTNSPPMVDKPVDPATSVRCKYCNRHFATISIEEGLVSNDAQTQACASCKPFQSLYEALQSREKEHIALLDRGSKHHGRALAHEKLRNARVALENFLISIEALNDATSNVAQASFASYAGAVQPEFTDDPAIKPTPDYDQKFVKAASPQVKSPSPRRVSPRLKRRLEHNSRTTNLERKRIKFTESVEERPEYRGTVEFCRGHKDYVPGRHVVAKGSEYLDTSGSTLTFAKFTGQKKVGSTFIDIIPKDEVQDDGSGRPAVKSKGEGGSKQKQSGKQVVEGESEIAELEVFESEGENDNSQMTSRDLRSARRLSSTAPFIVTRSRRKIVQHDGQDDDAEEDSVSKPSLFAFLKASDPGKKKVSADEQAKMSTLGPGTQDQNPSRDRDCTQAAQEAPELAKLHTFVTNVQRELSSLEQTSFTSTCTETISQAVRGVLEVLEPLKKLLVTRADEAEANEEAPEEDSMYFDALPMINSTNSPDTLQSNELLKGAGSTSIWIAEAGRSQAADEGNAKSTLDTDVRKGIAMEVERNVSGFFKFDTTVYNHDPCQEISVPSVEVAPEETLRQITTKSTLKPVADDWYQEEKLRGSPSSLSRALLDSKPGRRRSRRISLRSNVALSVDGGQLQQEFGTPAELIPQASAKEPFCYEAAGDLHQSVGELSNGQAEKQGIPTQSESEASNKSSQTSNMTQNVSTTPAGSGEATRLSDVLITASDRHLAVEAQVDPDTARNSRQVGTISVRDPPAEHTVGGRIESFNEQMHRSVEHCPKILRDEPSDSHDLNVKWDVANHRIHRTAMSQVEVRHESLNGTGIGMSGLDRVDERVTATLDAKDGSVQGDLRGALSWADKEIADVHGKPDVASDKDNAYAVMQPPDIVNTEPQANEGFAFAVTAPGDTTERDANAVPYLHSDTINFRDKATMSTSLAATKPQDPDSLRAGSPADSTRIDKAGVAAHSCDARQAKEPG